MKELRVEDALLYLDQVKVEFGDRPHIYNEFLDIMKTFKTQQIDTPGVIRRVSNLFQGNRRLVLGFNTFLPEGYKIELPADGDGPPIAVYRAPGSSFSHVLSATGPPGVPPLPPEAQQHASSAIAAVANAPPVGPGNMRLPAQTLHSARPLPIRATTGPHPPPQRVGPGPPQQSIPAPEVASIRIKQGEPFPGHPQGPPPMAQPPIPHSVRSPMDTQASPAAASQPSPPPQQELPMQAQPPSSVSETVLQNGLSVNHRGPAVQLGHYAVPPSGEADVASMTIRGVKQEQLQQPLVAAQQVPAAQQQQTPLEFDHAINYVTTIKRRFATEPETYKKFLEILHTYQKEQRGIKEVLDEVSELFADHEDLLKQFTYFLPEAVQAQAKAQLDEAVKEAEARKRTRAKQAIMQQAQGMQQQVAAQQQQQREQQQQQREQKEPRPARSPPVEYEPVVVVPFGATQGRTAAEEREILKSAQYGITSFAPVRPPVVPESSKVGQTSVKAPRPRTIPPMPISPNAAETAFFYRVKHHLSRKELSPEKPVGSKRHTPYVEFIKCLHLFGAGILNKEELFLLLRGLLTQGHAPKAAASNPQITSDAADLLREFEQIFVGRGPYATQEAARVDRSKYGTYRARDMDFTDCEHPTPSYWSYPEDFPASLFLVHPSRHHLESQILNDALVSIPEKRSIVTDSLEAYDGIKKRQNSYEEAMARIEDERYEIDMAIARNAQAFQDIEPLAQECLRLRQGEEKDGQPIGRLQYKIKRSHALNSVVINAIARVYGDRGDEVIQHLHKNPLIVLPIVYQRLKQKHEEWKKIKDSCKEQWVAITEANYEGCMDTQCHFRRRNLEKSFGSEFLVNQCKLASHQRQHSAQSDLITFSVGVPDQQQLFYEPCISVKTGVGSSHYDTLQLLAEKVRRNPTAEPVDLERIGRIWAEFMVPWYGYPVHWVIEEVRQSFSGRLSQSVVKFALGQKVKTVYGTGIVTLFEGGKYRVKLPFGTAYLGPSAILHAIPSKENPYIRRDGKMERTTTYSTKTEGPYLPKTSQVMFVTRRIYLFLRLHLQLCNMLSDLRSALSATASIDPATYYVVQPGKDPKIVPPERLNYAGMMSSLKTVVSKKCDQKTFETFGRKISREHVHVMAALPKLVDRCAEALISLAKEDALLHLYDYCQYRELNPSIVREHCFSMAPDADFRVQFDGKSTAFSFMPRGVQLPSGPRSDAHIFASYVNIPDSMDVVDMVVAVGDHDEPVTKRMKMK